MVHKGGLSASNQFESGTFVRSDVGVKYLDFQYHFFPIAMRNDARLTAARYGFQAHVRLMRSPSRGAVILRNATPKKIPKILFNYVSHNKDWSDFRKAIHLTQEIFEPPAFTHCFDYELQRSNEIESEDALNQFTRQQFDSVYHSCRACKIGRFEDPLSVIDCENRVNGVDRLRAVDSSVFP